MVGSFILNIIPILGQIASFALSWVVMSFLMFGLFLIVDRGMEFWPAALESINMVKKNFWNFLLFGVLTAVIGSAGIILCGIGMALTVPIQLCAVAAAYREIYGGGAQAASPSPQATPQA
jgi:uncharacterized membrane protein